MEGLFDDTEPEDEKPTPDGVAGIEESSSFSRYVSEGLALLEEWLSHPD